MEFRRTAYLLIVIAGLGAGLAVSQRVRGIFACQARDYGDSRYLAYCGGSRYGDYDHGAFWFDMEPEAEHHAAEADVLLLGNSRLLAAFSTRRTDEWFASVSRTHYLLGFMFWNTSAFSGKVVHKLKPSAKLYVINVDQFFKTTAVGPARFVMTDPEARSRYGSKRRLQPIHRVLCGAVSLLCSDKEAWFRSIETGAMLVHNNHPMPTPTSEDPVVDEAEVSSEVLLAQPFLDSLGVPRSCVIFTLAPHRNTPTATAKAIAEALGVQFIAPRPDNMATLDGAHLDAASAERWSTDFFHQAGPALRTCLGVTGHA